MPILNIYKPLGWTPLDCIKEMKATRPELENSPITYAGRLDPMAEGVIVVLTDDDRHNKEEFQGLEKVYEATFLFGVSSDTYDALGIITQGGTTTRIEIEESLPNLKGDHQLPFPPYSSYKVQGKALHWWANEGRLDEIEIPNKLMSVVEVTGTNISEDTLENLRSDALERIQLVSGDFRQTNVTKSWNALTNADTNFFTASVTLKVTSGTYIRSLAQMMGEQLGCGAILLKLKRISVGQYNSQNSQRLLK
jgi:tRNA pseudouridine55 synthase